MDESHSLLSYEEMMTLSHQEAGARTESAPPKSPKEKLECSKLTSMLRRQLHIDQVESSVDIEEELEEDVAAGNWEEEEDPHILLNASKVAISNRI